MAQKHKRVFKTNVAKRIYLLAVSIDKLLSKSKNSVNDRKSYAVYAKLVEFAAKEEEKLMKLTKLLKENGDG